LCALVGIGAAAAVGGVLWYFLAPKGEAPATAVKPATALRLIPGPGTFGLATELTF